MRSRIALAFTLCTLLSPLCSAFNNHAPFDISADLIDYVDADQSMTAEGHVIVIQGTSTLKADWMRYERVTQKMFAKGHVNLSDNGALLLGDTLHYDLQAESGTVTNALGYQNPWIFSGANWHKEMDYLVGHQVKFTSCDLSDPHYHLRSSSVHLVPDQQFWAWNNLAYVDTLPVFYSPFFYRNLAKRRVVMQFQPGHDDTNGNFLKTITTVRITDHVYDKVYFDHYSDAGNGFGNEFNYQIPGKMHGSLFGYYINPHANPDLTGAPNVPQYTARAYHWQQLDAYDTLQSNVNLRKNISFNNLYFPQDVNQSVNDIISSIALTRAKGKLNQRLVVERQDAPDAGDTSPFAETHVQTASYPRYDVTLYQVPLWSTSRPSPSSATVTSSSGTLFQIPEKPKSSIGAIMLSAGGSFGNTYQRLDDQYHPNANGSFTLNQSYPLGRYFSLTPSVTPSVRWQDKFDAQPPPPAGSTVPVSTVGLFRGYQGRGNTSASLRWRPFSAFTIDQNYSLTARMEPNGTQLDRSKQDGGIETHHLSWLAYLRPSRRTLFRSFSGFDMRKLADEDPNAYNQRKFDPWTSELTYQPTQRSEYFLRYQLGYYPFRDTLWEGDYTFRGLYKTLIQTGLLYNRGAPGMMTWNNTIGIFLSPGWRVDATIHTQLPADTVANAIRKGTIIDDTFEVVRDMHCWQARFVYQNIPPITRSYSILFDVKLGVKAREEITNNQLETQYYPWRGQRSSMEYK